jgi:hypothetical protein
MEATENAIRRLVEVSNEPPRAQYHHTHTRAHGTPRATTPHTHTHTHTHTHRPTHSLSHSLLTQVSRRREVHILTQQSSMLELHTENSKLRLHCGIGDPHNARTPPYATHARNADSRTHARTQVGLSAWRRVALSHGQLPLPAGHDSQRPQGARTKHLKERYLFTHSFFRLRLSIYTHFAHSLYTPAER